MTAIYSLLSAARTQERNLEVTSNNLSNANTTAFKADKPVFRQYLKQSMGTEQTPAETDFVKSEYLSPYNNGNLHYSITDDVVANMEGGMFEQTGNPLDFALKGNGFFTIETPQGTRYTKDGQFQKSTDGYLVDAQGNYVLGKGGAIWIEGKNVTVTEDGLVEVDGLFIDQLQVVEFEQPESLSKVGGNYYAPASIQQTPYEPTQQSYVHQGMIEKSNVSLVAEMTNLIQTNRSFDAAQRAIRVMDDLEEQSIRLARI